MFDLSITTLTIIGSMFIIVGFVLMEVPIIKIMRMMLKYMKCVERDIDHINNTKNKHLIHHNHNQNKKHPIRKKIIYEQPTPSSQREYEVLEVPDLNIENTDHSIW